VPVATSGIVLPIWTVAVAGVTAMAVKVAAGTVTSADPELAPEVAVIVAVPADMAVVTPVVSKTVATGVLLEVQVTLSVISTVVPSE
jgi:hypothetical protein